MSHILMNRKMISASFFSDLPTIKGLITDGFSPYIKLMEGSMPYFPVWGLTECQRWILDGDWEGSKYESEVQSLLRKNQEVMSFWKDDMRFPVEEINFQLYTDVFYADDPMDSYEEECREEYLSNGRKPIDVDLWIAVNKFDYKEVERLLKAGADPEVEDGDDEINCRTRISTECSYLDVCTDILNLMFKYERNGNVPNQIDDETLNDLIGFAAHEKMYALMQPYFKEE